MLHYLKILLLLLAFPLSTFAASFTITPQSPVQGDPLMVILEDVAIPDIKSVSFMGKKVAPFLYQGKPTLLIPIDLNQRAGEYPLVVTLTLGQKMTQSVTVVARQKIVAPLGIPQKLGGNTKQAESNLVTTLSKENAALAKVKITALPWWGEPFIFPLKNPIVTDEYGYSRKTGSSLIAHKGADFRASIGTPVKAINGGVVRLAREFIVYGKTVAIDHGGGVTSLSMHLSKLNVKEGQRVKQGDVIGLSGESGYALEPHLHLSVRISGISIDPMKFFALFTPKP